MLDMNSKIKEELKKITPIVEDGIDNAKKTSQYSKIIREIVLKHAELLNYFNSSTEKKLEEIFRVCFNIDEKIAKKVAHNTRDWFEKNQMKVQEAIKKINSPDKQIESTVNIKPVKNDSKECSEDKHLDIEDNESKDKNNSFSKEVIKEIATDTQKVVSLSDDATETISRLNQELNEKNMELSNKDDEIKCLENENLELKKTLETKVSNLEDNNEYKVHLDVKTALKLQGDAREKMIPLELETSIIDGVKAFVTKYALLDINDVDFGSSFPQSKVVKAALIAILKKNNFL